MLFARVFPEQGKRRTEGEKQIRESSERVVENSTAWFVFLGRCKTGPGAARRPTRVSVRRNPTRVHACECVCAHGGHCLPLLAGSEKKCRNLRHHAAPKQSAPQMARGAKGAPFKRRRRIGAASHLAVAPSWLSSAGTRHPQQGLVPLCWSPTAARAGPSTFPGPSSFLELCNLRDSALALGLRVFSSELVSVDAGQAVNPPLVVFADPLHPSRQPLVPIPAPPLGAAAPAEPRGLCAGGRAAGWRGPTSTCRHTRMGRAPREPGRGAELPGTSSRKPWGC